MKNRLQWLGQILKERFGHDFILSNEPTNALTLRLKHHEGSIVFPDLVDKFVCGESNIPCAKWDAIAEGWDSVLESPLAAPGFAQLRHPLIECQGANYFIYYDIIGLAYWMLARVEEIGRKDLDIHGRFPATSSHAFRHGYLERPIVDEWLHVLSQVIRRCWPTATLKTNPFSLTLSHDVDRPYQYLFLPLTDVVRQALGDLVKRGDFNSAFNRLKIWYKVRDGNLESDPFNTFDWIMDFSEEKGFKSAFYFISGKTHRTLDADYELHHSAIRSILKKINARGHEIGLHPSYNSHALPEVICSEWRNLLQVCGEEGIQQDCWGGRMHYLRWVHPLTLYGLESSGLSYDTTLGYPDQPGFRCGTCFEYPGYDPIGDYIFRVKIRPLIVMDTAALMSFHESSHANGLFSDRIAGVLLSTVKVGGNLTVLWHNSSLSSEREKRAYMRLVSMINEMQNCCN